jgi:hypothetical protein
MDITRSEPAGAGDISVSDIRAGDDSAGGNSAPVSGPGQLEQTLVSFARLRASGLLRVAGEPGGVVYLEDGRITAISTPGAPDPEVILLRSGRVPEAGWSAVYAAAASDGRMAAELVKRELVGAGELEAVLRTALADAMFALLAGLVEECRLEEAATSALLPLAPAAEAEWLLAEAARRLEVLAGLASPVSHDRDRLAAVPGAWIPRVGPGDGQAEILALANGRRTARDMSFVLGRGVYAVTLQLSRMRDAGLLVIGSTRSAGLRAVIAESAPPSPARSAEAAGGGSAPPLPRRRRGSNGPVGPRPPEKTSVLRMLRTGVRREPSGG